MNPLKQRLAARQPAYGGWLSLASPLAAEALAHAGFDFLVVDTEHAPADTMDVVALLQAISAGAALPIVRVTENLPLLVTRAMDAGAQTVLFPNVNSAAEARRAVASMRYPKDGNGGLRGVAGVVRAARFGLAADYLATANDDACTIVQIESAAALAAVDEIAALPGVDALFVGPADLSASLGHLGQPAHPAVQRAIARIAEAAAAAGKAAGILALDTAQVQRYRELGFSLVAIGLDTQWLLLAARQALAAARQAG
jgi:2-dehydro-3-deoxyglucarate aldolase